MKISDIITQLETFAPVQFQESYDNAGPIVGELSAEFEGVLVALDATESVIDEAISKNCNLVVSHHPIIFKGLKRLTGKNYVERTILKAIKNDVAIYASHTNLDNIKKGVNNKIAEKLGLQNLQILQPKQQLLKKLITFSPVDNAEEVKKALFAAGAGHLGNYSECSFTTEGVGTFKPEDGANPHVGELGTRHEEKEIKIEVIFPGYMEQKIIKAMNDTHPYEEVAYDIITLDNILTDVGSGMIGNLEEALDEIAFLGKLKSTFNLTVLKHTSLSGKRIKKVAVCGGAGSFLTPVAISYNADAYITSDIKYHEFFDADGMLLIDIGHYESEQFTIDLLYELLKKKYPNFAVLKTEVNTNPVNYFF